MKKRLKIILLSLIAAFASSAGATDPTLSFTGNAGFISDAVEPNVPFKNSPVRFEIKYTQAENQSPIVGFPRLIVKQYGIVLGTYTMLPSDIADMTYTDGKNYNISLNFSNPGVYEYYFHANSTVNSGIYTFFVSNIYHKSGDFSTSALFGFDNWDSVYDIAVGTNGSQAPYSYILGSESASNYLIKYSSSGAFMSYAPLISGVNYKKVLVNPNPPYDIYLGGDYYDYASGQSKISLAKYDSSLLFVSSESFSPTQYNYFRDMAFNSSRIFLCIQVSDTPSSYAIGSVNYSMGGFISYDDVPATYSDCRKIVADNSNVFALVDRDNDPRLVKLTSSLVYVSSVSVSSMNYYGQMAMDQSENIYLAGNRSTCDVYSCQNYITLEKRDSSLSLSTETYLLSSGWSQPSGIFVDTNSNLSVAQQIQNSGNSDYGLYVFDTSDLSLKSMFFSDNSQWDMPKAVVMDSNENIYLTGTSEVSLGENSATQSDIITVRLKVDLSQNREPSLMWANENGYWGEGIEPNSAMLGQTIVYKVKYQDLDNDPPNYIRVRIYKDGAEISGSPFLMLYDSGASPIAGEVYKLNFVPSEAGYYSYKFEAQDFHSGAPGLMAKGFPAQQVYYGPNIGEGFSGNLSLSTGTAYSIGGELEPEDITVFSRSGEGDYVYALAEINNSPYILKLSTGLNSVAISSQIISNDYYDADLIFNDGSNIYLAGITDIASNYWLDVRKYDNIVNNTKSGSFSLGSSNVSLEDSAFYGSSSYILFRDLYNGKQRARVSAFDSTLTHVGISGADDVYFIAHNATSSNFFDVYPASMEMDASGNIFVAGYYYDNEYSTSSSNNIFVAKFDSSSSYAVSSFTFTSPGNFSDDKASGISLDSSGNIYVSGNINNGQKNLWLVLKLDSSLNLVASRVFDAGDMAESMDISFSTQANSVFVSGSAYLKNNFSEYRHKGLVVMFDSNLVFKSSFTYGAEQNEENYFGPMDLNSSGQPYILGLKQYWGYNYGGKKLVALKPQFSVDKATFTLTALKKSDSSPMKDMNVAMIPYNSKGYPDMGFMEKTVTNSLGQASFSAIKGIGYLIAISTPGFGPKVLDQVMDPYGNFNKTFYSNVSSTYSFNQITNSANTLRVNVLNAYKGAFLMGEVYFVQNNERAGYGIMIATGPSSTMEIHNLPAISAGSYGVNINMPGWVSKDVYPYAGIPSSSTLVVDMKDAMPPFSNYTQTVSSSSAFFSGFVGDMLGNALSGASVRVYCNCIVSGCQFDKTVYTDSNGRFSMYGYDNTCAPLYYNIGRLGYNSIPDRFAPEPSIIPPSLNNNFNLIPATYSVSGYIKYMGNPVAYAKLRIGPDWEDYPSNSYLNNDSYMKGGNIPLNNSDFFVTTDGDGYFSATGISDGNMRLQVESPVWKNISGGMDNDGSTLSDNIRITISSVAASYTPGYPCVAGKNWVLDSTGTCKGVMPYVFDIGVGVTTDSVVTGNLIFATTYTVSAINPLVISKSSAVVIGVFENCQGYCPDRKSFFTTVVGTYTSNIVAYSVSVSSWDYVNNQPRHYWLNVLSNSWAKVNSFDSDVYFSTGNVFVRNISLTRSGRLVGTVKNTDGSVYLPNLASKPRIVIRGETVSYEKDIDLNDDGTFEFPNIPGGKYDAILKFESGSSYVPLEMENVVVNEGKTTNITFTLKTGLYVQPKIYGLPEISTSAWRYSIIAVPSGQQMSSYFITEMFFKKPMYSFDYDASASTWSTIVLPEGRFDFYLTLASKYCPEGDSQCYENYTQFANFIGRSKNVDIKYDPNSPNLGTASQPININILGSLGQTQMGGWGKGNRVFTDSDYERLFADFSNQIMSLIPSVMIYDTAGELKGFSHIICDKDALSILENGINNRDSQPIKDSIAAGQYKYYIWGLPPGKYTAVFSNPNYPPVVKNITLPENSEYNFDFDSANVSVGNIIGVVKSSSSVSSPLSGAMIYLKGRITNKYAVTDSSGGFSFSNLPAGSYRIEFSMDGFAREGKKFSLGRNDTADLGTFYLKPTSATISGKIYISRFPNPAVKEGVKVSAYDETVNVTNPQSYLPILEDLTDENGIFEIKGVLPGHNYRMVVAETGKKVFSTVTYITDGVNNFGEISLSDLPPEIVVKLRKDADSPKKVNVTIQSPKELVSIPSCKYNAGQVYDSSTAVSLALVPAANNTYMGQFTISAASRYYSLQVSAGDSTQVEKNLVYDSVSNSKTEQYISAASLLGGSVYMDSEKEEYSGLELDAGALTQTSTATIDLGDLTGGFFSAMPNVRMVKTNKGDLSIDSVIQNIMASEVYDIDLSNAQANKSFTLSLKYDKEKAASSGALKIYQYDSASGMWKEVPGTYDMDPTLGIISVSVDSLDSAYEGASGGTSPMARKAHKMSSVSSAGYYVASSAPSSQTGKFAVFSAKPPSGTVYSGSGFEIYNMPNPFNLKDKTISVSDGWSGVSGTNYVTRGTLIKYFLPSSKSGSIKLVIYNNAGEKVRTLDEGSRAGGQIYYAEWDGKNDKNEDCASGVYFLMTYLNGDKLGSKPHKMALIK
ncbi:MAG: hypothetical protein Fur0012_00130 [Elusimicrobiota bacterium]